MCVGVWLSLLPVVRLRYGRVAACCRLVFHGVPVLRHIYPMRFSPAPAAGSVYWAAVNILCMPFGNRVYAFLLTVNQGVELMARIRLWCTLQRHFPGSIYLPYDGWFYRSISVGHSIQITGEVLFWMFL